MLLVVILLTIAFVKDGWQTKPKITVSEFRAATMRLNTDKEGARNDNYLVNKRKFFEAVGSPSRKVSLNGELPHWFWECRDGTVQVMIVLEGIDDLRFEIVGTFQK